MAASKKDKRTKDKRVTAHGAKAARRIKPPRTVIPSKPVAPGQRQDDRDAVISALRSRVTALEEQVARLQAIIGGGSDSGEVTLHADTEVNIHTNGHVRIDGPAAVTVNAANIELNAAHVQAAGVVRCATLVTDHVDAKSYTPGAGNIA